MSIRFWSNNHKEPEHEDRIGSHCFLYEGLGHA